MSESFIQMFMAIYFSYISQKMYYKLFNGINFFLYITGFIFKIRIDELGAFCVLHSVCLDIFECLYNNPTVAWKILTRTCQLHP